MGVIMTVNGGSATSQCSQEKVYKESTLKLVEADESMGDNCTNSTHQVAAPFGINIAGVSMSASSAIYLYYFTGSESIDRNMRRV
jgi:hypothetical protein